MARSATTDTNKKNRRGNGEGTIHQKPNGKWMAQALLGYKPDGPPKTNAGYRKIAVPQAVLDVIAEWKLYVLTLPKAEQMLDTKNAVFASTTTGGYRTYQGFRASYRHFLRRHNLDDESLNLHRYRHTYATMLLETGINPRVVQKLIGHSNISTTLGTYSHVAGEVYENVASGLETTFDKLMDGSYTPTLGTAEAASTAFRLLGGEK
ncbi:Phage integrase family protein [Sporobacter termitidis DSM 10068]|uniref:Phage integrase family protein n=1 Tax=Sporobacter termitidis DSM 10068 TaxID=1123282 RepID=A0A1M5W629_9FIRM|nr:tyrosine-type recombinase/integrase [Sporobacter termitidis]SHH82888.1 Phage integrase family protein [Sporobacter termitidis DSM 10068]